MSKDKTPEMSNVTFLDPSTGQKIIYNFIMEDGNLDFNIKLDPDQHSDAYLGLNGYLAGFLIQCLNNPSENAET